MNQYEGSIFSGELDQANESFYLTQVKNLHTQSNLSERQLKDLYDYIGKQEDSCMLTINDQLPILLKMSEVNALQRDLTSIMNAIKSK